MAPARRSYRHPPSTRRSFLTTHLLPLPFRCLISREAPRLAHKDRDGTDMCALYLQKSSLQIRQIPWKWVTAECPFTRVGTPMGSTQRVSGRGSPSLSPCTPARALCSPWPTLSSAQLAAQSGGRGSTLPRIQSSGLAGDSQRHPRDANECVARTGCSTLARLLSWMESGKRFKWKCCAAELKSWCEKE